ncbi:MAG: pentapeptide repeat-containing protein [Synechococcaceae cyanobacterium]|nr:pentapeptide repeat-containing protein [Synechococcaceae cyanobacterium]
MVPIAAARRRRLPVAAPLLSLLLCGTWALEATPQAHAANDEQLIQLLDQRRCRNCRLQDADLVHADLRDTDLRGAQLQRANLSQARLDGANLSGADLSFSSLQGASLRGADLRGARLQGTDLRQSDLSGAQLLPGALAQSHWSQAVGLAPDQLSYPQLHNAGVDAAQAGRHPEAERLFGDAIRLQPSAAISWLARGISRNQQGKTKEAAQDLGYAAALYEQAGDVAQARALREASAKLLKPQEAEKNAGNGSGSQLLGGAVGLVQLLAPLAAKAFMPLPF